MFCGNCGKQLPDNSKFCGHCGAPAECSIQPMVTQPIAIPTQNAVPPTAASQASVHTQFAAANYQSPIVTQPTAVYTQAIVPTNSVIQTKGAIPFCIVAFLLHLLNLIFWFIPTLSLSAGISEDFGDEITVGLGASRSESLSGLFRIISDELFGTPFSLFTIIEIFCVALSGALVVRLLEKKALQKTPHLIFPKTFTIISLLLFLLVFLLHVASAGDSGVKAGLTVAGYFYILSMVSLIVILFIITRILSLKKR